jgi:prepilin-type N-terminal cleavage/methylation domain-containing protein
MLRNRAGFTLAEVMVALSLTAVIGAAVTGVFVTQSKFYDRQEKIGFARGVSRGAVNVMMSEMRMLERGGAIAAATNKSVTIRVPYALGLVCGASGGLHISRLPVDPAVMAENAYSGYAYRTSVGSYTYIEGGTSLPEKVNADVCNTAGITIVTNGEVLRVSSSAPADIGAPAFLYRIVTYEFKNSAAVPGRIGLWRHSHGKNVDEELVAPFDTTAKFRFYVNDAAQAQTDVPGTFNTITGLELILDGVSERPDRDGTFQNVPHRTSVFFKNRL